MVSIFRSCDYVFVIATHNLLTVFFSSSY
jgi:hypothetical protein